MNLQDALKESGVVQSMAELKEQERQTVVQPQRRWWQNFRLSLTKFEIPVLLVVRCEKWEEGLKFIREHNLNKTTTRCKTEAEARDQVRAAIVTWYSEDTPKKDDAANGSLVYWRLY